MPGYINIQVIGDVAGVQAMLSHLEQKLSPPSMAAFLMTHVDPYLRKRAGDRFQGEGDDATGQWAPLTAATQSIRAQQGYGADHPINRRTGELENYIRNSPSGVTAHPAGATLTFPGAQPSGELADKLTTAQQGRVAPNTVPRPVLAISTTDLAAVLTAMAYEIQRP